MRSRTNSPLAILALIALMIAQVFGLQQGYVCVCHGDPVVTESGHCHSEENFHAPHEAHNSHAPDCPEHASDSSATGDHHSFPHQPMKQDMKSSSPLKTVQVPAPLVAVLSMDWVHLFFIPVAPTLTVQDTTDITIEEKAPPAALVVTRCMVMLV